MMSLTKKIKSKREHGPRGASTKVNRHVLIVALASGQRKLRLPVNTNGDDGTKGPDKVICQRQRARISDNLKG
jgi:hypothetical protein